MKHHDETTKLQWKNINGRISVARSQMGVLMQKTKLGLSVGLLAAITYLLPIVNSTIFFIVVAYVLVREENIWLKKTVVKATAIFFIIHILYGILNFGSSGMSTTMLQLVPDLLFNNRLFGMFGIFTGLLSLIKYAIYIAFAILSLKQGTIKIGFLDNFINRHMDITEE